jgi:hypothetical protein
MKAKKAIATLPVNEIQELRLMLTSASHGLMVPAILCKKWVDICNEALEQKQADYWTNFDDVTEQNPIGI